MTLVDKAGVPHHHPTRFTLVYVKVDGRWLVAEYHNSATPGPY